MLELMNLPEAQKQSLLQNILGIFPILCETICCLSEHRNAGSE